LWALKILGLLGCDICGQTPCLTPVFCNTSRDLERQAQESRRDDRIPENWEAMSFGELYEHLNSQRPTPQTTIEAILYCVRERGVAALDEPKNIERLQSCDDAALAQINHRIGKLMKGEARGLDRRCSSQSE
jgi:hypothetical protein